MRYSAFHVAERKEADFMSEYALKTIENQSFGRSGGDAFNCCFKLPLVLIENQYQLKQDIDGNSQGHLI